jgi:uncharacterized protein (TIGR00288 family)
MTDKPKTQNMAVFCDFENVALGVEDARYAAFDIKKVLERILLKGNIVVKKAYCDWERYKKFKAAMHEAAFELIEIPHLRQSGKNSADIRMVVDALDLCYTKSHVDTFVIISGDSDFSPLVSKLRENNKLVIGVGVKQSTSDLLMASCDEFIYYDDLVRDSEKPRRTRRKSTAKKANAKKATSKKPAAENAEEEHKRQGAIDLVIETVEDLFEERGEEEKVWGSMVKQALKRRQPGFSETYHGFRNFGQLLEEARDRELLELEHDEKSGGYIIRGYSHDD